MNLIEIILYWGKLYLPNAISNSDTLEFSNILFIVKHPSYKWAALCRRDKAYDSVRPFTHCILKSDPWKKPLLIWIHWKFVLYLDTWPAVFGYLFCSQWIWNERQIFFALFLVTNVVSSKTDHRNFWIIERTFLYWRFLVDTFWAKEFQIQLFSILKWAKKYGK